MPVFDSKKLFDKDKVAKSLESIVWGTPDYIFKPLNEEFNFTLDVCADKNNAKCIKYFTEKENGLLQSWRGNVCWCNPPYGTQVKNWVKKAYLESKNGVTSVLLIPVKTNTNWWHDLVIPFAEIRFIRGRIAFEKDGKQTKHGLPWAIAVIIYRGHATLE